MAGLGEVRAQAGVGDFVVLAGRVRVSDHIPGAVGDQLGDHVNGRSDPNEIEIEKKVGVGTSRTMIEAMAASQALPPH